MNKIANIAMIGATVLLLGGGGNSGSGSATPANKTALKLVNTKDSEASTDKQGKYTLHIQTDENADATISMENAAGRNVGEPHTFKLNSKGQGQIKIKLQKNWENKIYRVSAKVGSKEKTSKDFILDNKSTARDQYLQAKDAARDSKRISSSIAESKQEKKWSEEDAEAESTTQSSSATTKSSASDRYKKVDLETFVMNPDKYQSTDIRTTGTVTYIQHVPNEAGMDFVVIVPSESYTGHGMASQYGTVAQIETDTVKSKGIIRGSEITVYGGGLTDAVNLKGKTISSSIIVDKVTD